MKLNKLLENPLEDYSKWLDIDHDIYISNQLFQNLPYLPKEFDNKIFIVNCRNLLNLKGIPEKINGSFHLYNLINLNLIKYFPKFIKHNCVIENCLNVMHDLWRLPFCRIEGEIFIFDASNNESDLQEVARKYQNRGSRDALRMQNDLIDLGYMDDIDD